MLPSIRRPPWAFLLIVAFVVPVLGCVSNPTRADMVRQAAIANQTFTKVERSLNQAFSIGAVAPEKHDELDPFVKAARSYVQKLADNAIDPNFKPSQWRSVYDAFLAVMEPLVTASLNPSPPTRRIVPAPLPTTVPSPPRPGFN